VVLRVGEHELEVLDDDRVVEIVVGQEVGGGGFVGSPGIVAVSKRLAKMAPRMRNKPIAGPVMGSAMAAGMPTTATTSATTSMATAAEAPASPIAACGLATPLGQPSAQQGLPLEPTARSRFA